MKESIYKGKILDLSVYDVEIEGRRARREMIEHRGAAAILAFDDRHRVIMVRQHRFPHGYVLEIPAGTLEEGEDPRTCAFREFMEETGHSAEEMSPLITYYPSIGYNTEAIHCFVASGVRRDSDLKPDEDEILSVEKIELPKLISMITSGRIQDSKTICAVLTHAAGSQESFPV